MPFDGPAGVLMQTNEQQNDRNEPAIFFVNIREPLRRFEAGFAISL